MKKLIRLSGFTILSLLSIIILVVGILSFLYSPGYVYRLAKYNVADVYDYIHFENREIQAADSAFSFPVSIDEPLVESLFHEKVEAYGFASLNEWAEKSQTTALIVIRRDTLLYEKYFNGFSRDSYFHSQSMADTG